MRRREILLALPLVLGACERFPRDSAGALERITRERVVRVGTVEGPPWVGPGGRSGLEPELVAAWARSIGARAELRPGPLDEQVEALHRRELDVLIAGLEAKTPYGKKVALTQPYLKVRNPQGKTEKRVMAVTQGESALLLSLDRFLKGQDEAALRRRVGATAP